MSLIINMLKDLEKRQGADKQLPPMATGRHAPASRFNFNFSIKYLYAASAVCLIAFIGLTVFTIASGKIVSDIKIPMIETHHAVQTAFAETDESITPTNMTNIEKVDIISNENNTDIVFTLNQPGLYDIDLDDTTHQVVVSFDNANFSNDIPTFDNSISQIEGVRFGQNTSDFIINLKQGALLESASLDNSQEKPRLIVKINNPSIKLDNVEFASAIKKPALSSIIINKYKTALHSAELGKTDEAIQNLSSLLKQYPDYNDVRVSLVALLLESKQLETAEKLVNDGLIITPDYIPLVELKAHILTYQGKKKEALLLLQREQPLISDYPDYHAFIAALYNQEDNYELAASIYRKLVKINPHQGTWWFGLGVSLDKMGSNEAAVIAYTKAATEGKLTNNALTFLQTRLQTLQENQHAAE